MSASTIDDLRTMNSRIRGLLERMQPADNRPAVMRPQEFCGLLEGLVRTGECLRVLPRAEPDPVMQEELDKYRSNLQRLRQILPRVHTFLLTERARLEGERARLAEASAWARARKNTL